MSYETNTDLESTSQKNSSQTGLFGMLVDGLNALGSIVIALVMLLMCADVFMRNTFNQPIDGVAELVATSIIVIVFLQLPATLRHGRMSRADLFIDPFVIKRPRTGLKLRAFFNVGGILACAVIAYASWPQLSKAWIDSEFFGIEGIFTFPTWPMRAIVVLGSVLAAVQYAMLSLQDWLAARSAS